MDIKTIVNEPRRGCGYRKEGGMYLMAGGFMAQCGKLPLRLDVCPCCGGGIKPARAWTWVDAEKLFAGAECIHTICDCPLDECQIMRHPRMGLVWVGSRHYTNPAVFLEEATRLGVSRRIPAVPKGFVIGETRVLFAHRETWFGPSTDDRKPGIFGCFRPDRIEYVISVDDDDDKLERLEKRGLTLVDLARTDGDVGAAVKVAWRKG